MDLDELRKEIDAVDRQIVALFEKRMEISERIAAYKQKVGMQVRDAKREQEKKRCGNLFSREYSPRSHMWFSPFCPFRFRHRAAAR